MPATTPAGRPETDLSAFITARLDEDEAAARALCEDDPPAGEWTVGGGRYQDGVWDDNHYAVCDARDGTPAAHIARHDPARVLREVAAKRAILARYEDTVRHYAPGNQSPDEYELWVLPDLAAVWSDHPDYRGEWGP